jgi:hypothetical protein
VETAPDPLPEKAIEIAVEPKVKVVAVTPPPKPQVISIPEPEPKPSVGDADRTVPELPTTPILEPPVTELPKTASPLPLLALIGGLSLGIARLLRTRH